MRWSTALLAVLFVFCACEPAPTGPISESGDLGLGDLTLSSGEYYDSYPISVGENQWLSVNVVADGFDPYLIIRTPSGNQSELDDSEESNLTSVQTVIRAQEGGTWDVAVTSYEPGETGSYTMTYEISDTAPAGAASSTAPEAVSDDGGAETVDA